MKQTFNYYVLKNSSQRELEHPFNPVSSELEHQGTITIDRISVNENWEIIDKVAWLLKETSIYNKKNKDKTISYQVKEGTYTSEEEE